MALPNTLATPLEEQQTKRELTEKRRQAARSSPGSLTGEPLRESIRGMPVEQFGAIPRKDAVREDERKRQLDAVRRQPSLPLTTPLGTEAPEEPDQSSEAVRGPEAEGRVSRLLDRFRRRDSSESGEGTAGALGGAADTLAAPFLAGAQRGYARVWDSIQESLEDTALSFADLMLLSGPASLGLYLLRLLGGHVIRPKMKGVQIIPPYSLPTFVYHSTKNILIALFVGFIYLVIIVLVYLINNKCKAAELISDELLAGILSPLVGALKLVGVCPS